MTPKAKTTDLFLLSMKPGFKVGDSSSTMVSTYDQTPSKVLYGEPIPGDVTWQDAKTLVVALDDGRVITIANYDDAKALRVEGERGDHLVTCLMFDETGNALHPDNERIRALAKQKRQGWSDELESSVAAEIFERDSTIYPASLLRCALHQPGAILQPPDTKPNKYERRFRKLMLSKAANHFDTVRDLMSDAAQMSYLRAALEATDVAFAVYLLSEDPDDFALCLLKGTHALENASRTGTFAFTIDALPCESVAMALEIRKGWGDGKKAMSDADLVKRIIDAGEGKVHLVRSDTPGSQADLIKRIIDAAKLMASEEPAEDAVAAALATLDIGDRGAATAAAIMATKLLEGKVYLITSDNPDTIRLFLDVARKLDARIEQSDGHPLLEGVALPPGSHSVKIYPAQMLKNAFHQPGAITQPAADLLTNPVSERSDRHFRHWMLDKAHRHVDAVRGMSDAENANYLQAAFNAAEVAFAVYPSSETNPDDFALHLLKGAAVLEAASRTGTFSFSVDALPFNTLAMALEIRKGWGDDKPWPVSF